MTKYFTNANTTLSITDATHAARAFAAYVKEINGTGKAFDMLDTTHMDATAPTHAVGLQQAQRMTFRGDYDDTATSGPHVVLTGLLGLAAAKQIVFSPDGTITLTGNWRLVRYEVTARHGEMVGYEAEFVSDGALTWA